MHSTPAGVAASPSTVCVLPPGETEWYLTRMFLHRGVDVGFKTAIDEAMEETLRKRKG